jgi:hypothetical protein
MLAGGVRWILPFAIVTLLGCRSVWVHPDATAEKYANDLFFCRQGMERSEWQARAESEFDTRSDRAWALEGTDEPKVVNRAWKSCMVSLGWDTVVGSRSSPPWRTPRPPQAHRRFGPK